MCPKIYPKDPWEKAEYVPVRVRALLDLVRPFLNGPCQRRVH